MTDAISVSSPVTGTEKTLSLKRAVWPNWPTEPSWLASATPYCWRPSRPPRASRRHRLLPAHRRHRRARLRRGQNPRAFFRREGKPSDQAVLTCRLIDRPLRPSFPKGFRNEIQVVGTIFSARPGEPVRRPGHQCRSAALMISRASPSRDRSAPCAWPTPPMANGRRTRRTKRATPRPSNWWSPDAP